MGITVQRHIKYVYLRQFVLKIGINASASIKSRSQSYKTGRERYNISLGLYSWTLAKYDEKQVNFDDVRDN